MSNRIKILSPIDRVEEIFPLIKAGADEFYCGVLTDNINLACIRAASLENSNLLNLTELKKLVVIVKKQNKNIFLVLNTPRDNIEVFNIIEKNISNIKKIAPDAVIVGNINLMNKLKNSKLDIIASSLLEVKNKETVRFLVEEFGVKKVILERQITIDDLDSIMFEFPRIDFEVFIMALGCRSLNSACNRHLITKSNKSGVHFCLSSFDVGKKNKVVALDFSDKKIIADRLKMPMPSCGACALFQFKEYPIRSVKIVGRGFLTKDKVKNVRFVRETLDMLKNNYSQNKFYQKTESLFEATFGRKCERQYCYYPHFFR
jgi:putative protease